MAQQTINLGTVDNDGTGDTLKAGGDKINDNFTELYTTYAPLGSPSFTGNPLAPTQSAGNSSTRLATTAFVQQELLDSVSAMQPPYVAGRWYIPLPAGALGTSGAISANTVYLHPAFIIPRQVTISDLACYVTTGSAGNLRLGIYASDPTTGLPTGTPVAETGNIDCTTLGALQGDITGANVTLDPGFYYSALISSATPVLQQIGGSGAIYAARNVGSATLSVVLPGGNLTGPRHTFASAFGAFPDLTAAVLTEVTGLGILTAMKVA